MERRLTWNTSMLRSVRVCPMLRRMTRSARAPLLQDEEEKARSGLWRLHTSDTMLQLTLCRT